MLNPGGTTVKHHAISVAALFLTATLAIGCKSKEDKCRELSLQRYQEAVAACKDEACKMRLVNYREGYEKECMK